MKALSLTQPWATLVAIGAKKIETRSWRTNYRGPLAIHAAKGFPLWAQDECAATVFARALWPELTPENFAGLIRRRITELPRGAIVATAEIVACSPTNTVWGVTDTFRQPREGEPEHEFGDYSDGRFMWFLENVRALPEPILCLGARGLWTVPAEIESQITDEGKRFYLENK